MALILLHEEFRTTRAQSYSNAMLPEHNYTVYGPTEIWG